MKKLRYSDSQILAIIKQAESCVPIPELCRTWNERRFLLQMASKVWR